MTYSQCRCTSYTYIYKLNLNYKKVYMLNSESTPIVSMYCIQLNETSSTQPCARLPVWARCICPRVYFCPSFRYRAHTEIIFNIIMYITIDTACASNGNVLIMSTVVMTPAIVMTVEKVSFCSSTLQIIKPYRSCSRTVSVSQRLSNIPNRKTVFPVLLQFN